ncbi:CD209 antigen-like protein C [Drosophila sechellia]|uniref:CD209 antigen-like protein C n=1 Tax=Drosophila sechellia TaxID=7238 RepID=UPI0013DE2951|nr:CD209 antigen-like protein C [Drosophila sechellia]
MSRILVIFLIATVSQNSFTSGAVEPDQGKPKEETTLTKVEQQQNNDEEFDQVQFLKRRIKKNQITKLYRHAKVRKVYKPTVKFEKFGAKYYHIENKEKLSWYESVYRCRSLDSKLISFQNQEEWNIIKANLRHYNLYWVDINDEATEGEFISESTGEKAPFFKWSYGEPNNLTDENCVEMRGQRGLFDNDPHSMNDISYCTQVPSVDKDSRPMSSRKSLDLREGSNVY